MKRIAYKIRAVTANLEGTLLGEALSEASGRRTVSLQSTLDPKGGAMANNGVHVDATPFVQTSKGGHAGFRLGCSGKHPFKLRHDPGDTSINGLLKAGKPSSFDVKVAITATEINEWWEKTMLVVPTVNVPVTRSTQSRGHCIFNPTLHKLGEG